MAGGSRGRRSGGADGDPVSLAATESLTYNPDGTVLTRTDTPDVGSGAIATYAFSYDWAGRPVAQTSTEAMGGSATWAYRADGLLESQTLPTATPTTLTSSYDEARRPSRTVTAQGSTTLATLTLTRDRAGLTTSEGRTIPGAVDLAAGTTQTFTYDGLGRMLRSVFESGSPDLAYAYDLDSNRISAGAVSFTYNNLDQLMTQDVTLAFGYDVYGNLTTNVEAGADGLAYAYDVSDHLVAITSPAGSPNPTTTVAMELDAAGRIAVRATTRPDANGIPRTTTSAHAYLGATETILRVDETAETEETAEAGDIDALLGPSGGRLANRAGSANRWLIPDLLGNVAASFEGGNLRSALRYDGYGRTAAAWASEATVRDPWRFQGRYDVSAEGNTSANAHPLYDLSARFYAPALGTFTQLDSVAGGAGDPISFNRYLYAEASPWTLVDPTGHVTCSSLPTEDRAACQQGQQVLSIKRVEKKQKSTGYDGNGARPRTSSSPGGADEPAAATPPAPTVSDAAPPIGSAPTLRDQLTKQCLDSGPQNYGYCTYFATAPGLDGPPGDDTPSLAAPIALASPLAFLLIPIAMSLGPETVAVITAAGPAAPTVAQEVASIPATEPVATGVVAEAAPAVDHIVLGLERYGLQETAAAVGGRHLMDDPDFMASVLAAAQNSATRITVALDGLRGSTPAEQVLNAVREGLKGVEHGATNWELATLFNAGRLPGVNFVLGGQPVPNPFVGGN